MVRTIDQILDHVDGRQQRVLLEGTHGEGGQGVSHLGLEGRGEGHEEDAHVGHGQSGPCPGPGDGFDFPGAVLDVYITVAGFRVGCHRTMALTGGTAVPRWGVVGGFALRKQRRIAIIAGTRHCIGATAGRE